MKKAIYLLFLMLYLSSCIDQKQNSNNNNTALENQNNEAILFTGTILNAPSQKFMLVNKAGESIPIQLDENGSFTETITTGSSHYIFYNSRHRLDFYFVQGEEYHLKTDMKSFKKSVNLTGTDLDASNYLMTKGVQFRKIRGSNADLYALNENEFKAKVSDINKSYNNYLESFLGIPHEFIAEERRELEYLRLLMLTKYQTLHRNSTKQPDFKVSENFLSELEKVDYLDEKAYKTGGSYDNLVAEHFKLKSQDFIKNSGGNVYFDKLKFYGAIPNEYIKNRLLGPIGLQDIAKVENKKEYYDAFVLVSSSSKNNEKVNEKFVFLGQLERGQPSPEFTNYLNHKGEPTSLSDFKGKYVYIDVWATWCAPCKAEIPSLKKVEKQYHGKNIEFVSISVDVEKKHDTWKKMVVSEQLTGLQLIADKNWDSDFIKGYRIRGIPRFILIDPDGNIVDADAPRPSNPQLISLFDELKI
ncbi:TlpA family protein disulfide reductase [Tamlana haliotis]|uniref:TlpA family protein disulfide reductase n=1 Tax=Pseudotamlana haliotis TaxID=2614804 RepID=A0A6N6MEH2_9FLAO|nr:TlpA disulfide reductase family protein [Tamlana haliotis]KAB1067718.1 TlpA family protein disulfide reductase [Tamlana haliotis]